jgi:hypothetical protein
MFTAFLLHHTWLGKRVLQPYLREDIRRGRQANDIHPVFQVGPLQRLSKILAEYNLSWLHVFSKWDKPREKRHSISRDIQRTIMIPSYLRYLEKLVTSSTDVPANHRRQLLGNMALSSKEAQEPPLYHSLSHALSVAGIVFRAPYLRYQFRGAQIPRAACTWCGDWEGEYGYHLIRCSNAPQRITALRDKALRLIHADVYGGDGHYPTDTIHLEEENMRRLLSLYWPGRASWGPKGRKDTGKQPDREALRASLLYMQETINAYAAEEPAVWALPTFINAPIPSTMEIECAMQAKAQHDLAASQDSLASDEDSFLDSLCRLGGVEDD